MIIKDFPFDESVNSPICYDYSPLLKHGVVHGANFVPGKYGYAIEFKGDDYVTTDNPPIDLNGDFTVLFWLFGKQYAPYSAPTYVSFQFLQDDVNNTIEAFGQACTNGVWELWAFSKSGNDISIYKNCSIISVKHLSAGNLVEWCVRQLVGNVLTLSTPLTATFGANDSKYAQGYMDGLLIYDKAMTGTQICQAANAPVNRKAFYWINDIPFTDHDVYVSASKGLVDSLKMKDNVEVNWADEHGRITDLRRPRFENRTIELDCFMKATGMLQWSQKVDYFLKMFTSAGTHRLKVEIDNRKPLVYEVYAPNGTDMKKRWYDDEMVGVFTLKLVEPDPVKRVLRFVSVVPAPGTFPVVYEDLYIVLKATSPVNIYWGDGTMTKDVLAEDYVTLWHKYAIKGKAYEIIIAGEIDNISEFMTNGIVIWNRF